MEINRRQFLIRTAQGSSVLILGIPLACAAGQKLPEDLKKGDKLFSSHYFKVTQFNTFTLVMDKSDMGQGTTTLFKTLFAEESEIPIEKIEVETAGVDPIYGTNMGLQITGGSTSTSDRFQVIREAGALLKTAMIKAAAEKLNKPEAAFTAKNGQVYHKDSDTSIHYGKLIELAEKQKISEVKLKDKKDFRYIGKLLPSVDALVKSTGQAEYGIDKELDNMVVAVVVRPPSFTAKLLSYNDSKVATLPGYIDSFAIPQGVALVFEKYWQTLKARPLLEVKWDLGKNKEQTSKGLYASYKASIESGSGDKVHAEGDIDKALKESDKTLEADYQLPYLAHATMEPMNCVAWKQKDRLDIYSPNQSPTLVRNSCAEAAGLSRDQVHVHTTKFLGGGFGRRSTLDYNLEATEIAKLIDRPVKLIWSREDDMQHSPMRPLSYHKFKGGIKNGEISAWEHKFAGQSIMGLRVPQWMPHLMPEWVPGFVPSLAGSAAKSFFGAPTLQEGTEIPYAIHNKNIRAYVQEDIDVPTHFWRSVGHSITGFVTESFFDELCLEAGKDPYLQRQKLLKDEPRGLAVLNKVAQMAKWGKRKNVFQGIAYHKSFNTYVAEVAEVTVKDKVISVDRVYCAVDCGLVVNPTIVIDQMRSGIIYGLSAALNGEITIDKGGVVQSNFHDYEPLRLKQTPEIYVAYMQNDNKPTGVGEPGLPPIAPAVANAVFKATGQRLRSLPLRLS